MHSTEEIPYGYCHCGCGEKTAIRPFNHTKRNYVKGEPSNFLPNHHKRLRTSSYLNVDCGYKTPCHIWKRYISKSGYGQTYLDGRVRAAHIVAYEEKYGQVPKGMQLDHLCRIRACRNPDHVEPVTSGVNSQRGMNSKINFDQARAIRAMKGFKTQCVIADLFGIGRTQVSNIHLGISWKEEST